MLRSVGSALLASHQQAASARAAVAVAAVHRLAPRHTTCIARAHIHSTATTHDESAAEPVAAASSDVKQVRPNIPAMVAAAGAPQRTMVRPTRSQRKARAKQNLNLREKPERSPVDLPASASLPKQKVAMYTKILRVLRSPVKGKVKTTSGDDYMLGQDETQSKNSHFTGLITANLSPPAPKRPARRAGKDTGRSYGKGGRKSARAHVWIQKAINKGQEEQRTEWRSAVCMPVCMPVSLSVICMDRCSCAAGVCVCSLLRHG